MTSLRRPYRVVRSLSALINPPNDHLVHVLRAYFDDSGSPDDCKFVTIAGYFADEYAWGCFEKSWQMALDEAEVPYLHVREFGDPNNEIYNKLRADQIKHLNFMLDLVAAIGDHLWGCVHATVKVADVMTINGRHSLNLDPLVVAIYGALAMIRRSIHCQESIEVIFDQFDKSGSRIDVALEYLSTDASRDMKAELITPIPLRNGESFKTLLPLQAADLAAWETRKYYDDRHGFAYSPGEKAAGHKQMRTSYLKWAAERASRLDNGQAMRRCARRWVFFRLEF